MRTLKIALIILAVSLQLACSNIFLKRPESLPSPAGDQGFCCWQAVQAMRLSYDEHQLNLSSVMAYTEANGVAIAFLGPLGNSLWSVTENHGVQVQDNIGLPEQVQPLKILRLFQLAWWPMETWQFSEDDQWRLIETKNARVLMLFGRPYISFSYSTDIKAGNNKRVHIQHHHEPLQLEIEIKNWHSL